MSFDHTAWADAVAAKMRAYYDANRPLTFMEKLFDSDGDTSPFTADNLMIGLLNIALSAEWERRTAPTPSADVSSLIERVAAAIFAVDTCWRDKTWENVSEDCKEVALRYARAAIAAYNTEAAMRLERCEDALRSIREHCAVQPSPLAKAIVATCDAALKAGA
jgi:hypothetical protein